ncbi:MAG: GerMN domain-containing protein [Spirochaetes bacterium]|nr:GerMN domain-containing protein [Spirochaetota bacterium]
MAQRKTGTRNAPGNAPRKKNGTGCLIWLVALLVTLLLFVFNWERIRSTLESTGFIDAVGGLDDPATGPGKGDGSLDPGSRPDEKPEAKPSVKPGDKPSAKPEAAAPPVAAPADTPAAPVTPVTPGPETAKPGSAKPGSAKPGASGAVAPPVASPMELVKSTRVAVLYFIRVDDDGVISRHEVKRTVGASDSPMTDALDALMAGPNADELNRGFISLIPADTRLLSAQVRGSTAYLNFNEAFMYNRYGIEGYAGQLKQIVYTATGYSTVKDVQILIEGQKRDYLGGDGVYIGKPLSRASF